MPTAPSRPSVTLQVVARAAGVSPITASRALANPRLVSETTLLRVQRAVESTGYIPNLLAGGLKSKRSMTIGALVPSLAVPQFLPTVQALTAELERAGYQLIIGQTGYDHEREAALVDTMLGRRVDGIVVAGLLKNSDARRRVRTVGLPIVETWDLTQRPCDMLVGFSHQEVGRTVARYFRNKGWHEVAMASGDDARAARRRQGFVAETGYEVPTAFVKAPSSLELGRLALADLLTRGIRFRAVFCSSDGLAQGVLTEAQARGLRVPKDLAVVGFGGADFAAHVEPGLTTVQIDGSSIGQHAAVQVLARCRGETVKQRIIDIGFSIIERASSRESNST